MFAHWKEHVADGLSNNFELGLEVCFLQHTTWVCKLNDHVRPCQMLLRCLKSPSYIDWRVTIERFFYLVCNGKELWDARITR